jgi:hypothetical protein
MVCAYLHVMHHVSTRGAEALLLFTGMTALFSIPRYFTLDILWARTKLAMSAIVLPYVLYPLPHPEPQCKADDESVQGSNNPCMRKGC